MNIIALFGILTIFYGNLGKADVHQLVHDKLSRVLTETDLNPQSTALQQNLTSFSTYQKKIENNEEHKLDYKNYMPEELTKINGNDNSYIPPRIQNNSPKNSPHQNSNDESEADKPKGSNQLLENSNSYIPPKIQNDLHELVAQLESTSQQSTDKVNDNYKKSKINEKHSKIIDYDKKGNEETNENIKSHVEYYQHSKLHVIDDPLPEKVNYVPHIAIDFPQAELHLKPLFTPAFVPSHLIPRDDIEPPADKYNIKATSRYEQKSRNNYKTTTGQPYTYIHPTAKIHAASTTAIEASPTTPNNSTENVNDPDIKFPGNIKIYNPKEDIVFINHHHGPATDFDLFNSHENYSLNLTLPEVIYKAGDDTSFADDLTVFDDYNHTFPPVEKDEKKTVDETTHTPEKDSESSASSPEKDYGETSASTKHSGENFNFDHGYVYEKPDMPFDT